VAKTTMESVIFGSVENMPGYGYGDGYGYGSGDGYGSGYGSGEEAVTYQEAVIACSIGERGERLREQGAVLAFWRSAKDGTPANGGGGDPRTIGTIEEIPGPLEPCTRNALHATLQPAKWKGERLWIVALYPPVTHVDDAKLCSLKREIVAEVPNWFN